MTEEQGEMKPCPFCGHAVDMDDGDTLYPTGTYWRESVYEPGKKQYIGRDQHNPETDHECYVMNCPESCGGCGISVFGDSKQDAIDRWNTRVHTMDKNENTNFTRITFEDGYGKYTIEVPKINLNIRELLGEVVAPVLKAANYPEALIDEYIDTDIR